MALRTPPSWLQNGSHPAENDRLTMQGIVSSTGIMGASSLQVTAQGSPNMTVNVAAGWASILSSTSNAGVYIAYNDATVVLNITAADATNPRKDIVVATVSDAYYSGSTNTVALAVIAGTASASPTPPSTPSNSILLATIAVAANTTTISSGNITDGRVVTTSNLINGISLPLAGGSLTGNLTTAIGTTALAPLKFQTATNLLSTPVGGSVEYDGVAGYLTPNGSATGGRAVIPAEFFYSNSGQRTLTAGVTTAQAIYGPTSGTGVGLALAGSTAYEYEIEGSVLFTTSSTTSNALTLTLNYTGTPTLVTGWFESALDGSSSSTTWASSNSTNISSVLLTSLTAATSRVNFRVKGILRTSTAGTWTPQVTFSATNTSAIATMSNSFAKVTPVGSSSLTSIGAWA